MRETLCTQNLYGHQVSPPGLKVDQDPRPPGTGNARSVSNRPALDVRTELLQRRNHDADACAQRGDTLDRGHARTRQVTPTT